MEWVGMAGLALALLMLGRIIRREHIREARMSRLLRVLAPHMRPRNIDA